MDKKYITVGQIINTHGIKGELRIFPLTDDIKRFEKLDNIYMGDNKIEYNIKGVKYVNNLVILKLEGLDNINDVLKYKQEYIYIDEEEKLELPEDHYFIFDIVGCKVFDLDDNEIGEIKDVITYSSNDVYVVKDKEKNKEHLIPAKKQFVKSIDIEDKIIIIDPIEGMIE